MKREKPLYVLYLRTDYAAPAPKKRVFKVTTIGVFHNERPGCEWDFVYGRGKAA